MSGKISTSRRSVLMGGAAAVAALSAPAFAMPGCKGQFMKGASYIDGVVAPEAATPVTYWSDAMLQAVRDYGIAPPPATRLFAMGHMAGMTALATLSGRYTVPHRLGEAPVDANLEVAYGTAVAKAMGGVLGVDTSCVLETYLDTYEDDASKALGIRWGTVAARTVLASRETDGIDDAEALLFPKIKGAMAWVPTGPYFSAPDGPTFAMFGGPLLPGWGMIKTWGISSAADYSPDPFPSEGSAEFARQYEKVRLLGGRDSALRTEDNAQVAFFWEDGPRGVTPPGHWQIIAMGLMQRRELDLVDQARFMALLSMAQADAGIATWHCKYDLDIIRPETAIRRGGFANADLRRDPLWETLIPTPPFPAYVSGHSMFSSSSARMLERLMGRDDIAFEGAAPDLINWPTQLTGVSRAWTSLSQAAAEGGASREYGGIHWESDNTEGLRIGAKIADAVFESALPAA
ncbi:MAG: vanadium-dependent haloperoxidase [Shimia sp.]